MNDVTVCIPTIPPRRDWLLRALASVAAQTVPPDAIAVAQDLDHQGVWVTRTRALQMARTRWVAFLDDDDTLGPRHLELLLARQAETGADLVYPCFETVPPGMDMLGLCGQPFNRETMATVTITVLVRRELACSIPLGPPNPGEINANDDHRLLYGVLDRGGTIAHLPERTWQYHIHGRHTSGQPHRWA